MTGLRCPLLNVLAEEFNNEPARHQGAPPSEPVWEAQADAWASHLATRLLDVAAVELRAVLAREPNVVCLHKAGVALDRAVAFVHQRVVAFANGLISLEEERNRIIADEGGES